MTRDTTSTNSWQPTLFGTLDGYEVRTIDAANTHWLLKNVHYARRIPSISYAFGLLLAGELAGVVTYGKPASPSLLNGVCGDRWAPHVLELNRLCLVDNRKNEASRLVGQSLTMLPRPSVVVSFADTEQRHYGFVYQATNWHYTGLSAKRTDWTVRGMEHLHGKTISDQCRGRNDGRRPVDVMREKYGDDFYLRERSRKHRYVFFVGTKSQRRQMLADLRYPLESYPKGAAND